MALATGAQAIHPDYGFLSENAEFADACERAGLVFIGPPASSIRAMGSKSAAKVLMEKARVPLVPGYHGENQEADFLHRQADAIGYPVLLKASAGGGGKGMRIVERSGDFKDALTSCQREASSSFGDDKVLIEKYLSSPRQRCWRSEAMGLAPCRHIGRLAAARLGCTGDVVRAYFDTPFACIIQGIAKETWMENSSGSAPLKRTKGGFRRICETELGEEQLCGSCGEFWPTDAEFFNVSGDCMSYECKACTLDRKRSRTTRQPVARLAAKQPTY